MRPSAPPAPSPPACSAPSTAQTAVPKAGPWGVNPLTGVCINIMDLDITWLSGINSVLNR